MAPDREERFIINGHIAQTIRMLNHLPSRTWPTSPKLPVVTTKMDGTGYPKRLKREDAESARGDDGGADILTLAADRPQERQVVVSESAPEHHGGYV